MRTGAAAGTNGYFHETALYASDADFLDIVVPFLREGVVAGEPTVVTCAEHNASLVRGSIGSIDGITFLPGADQYSRPAVAIRSYRAMFASLVLDGAEQIRVVGDVPHPGTGGRWEEWLRYEAVVNTAYDDFPVWGMCPYDTRTAPPDVIDDVLRTHAHVATPGSHADSPAFGDPASVAAARVDRSRDPLEDEPPAAVLADPTAAAARRVADEVARRARLLPEWAEDLALVVTELVTNAHVHGRPPVTVQLWSSPGRVVASVRDAGTGPVDALVGLVDPGRALGGRGLWLAHQLSSDIALVVDDRGFTVRVGFTDR